MKFNELHSTFLVILENRFPLVYKKKKDTNKWITKDIRTSCNHNRALYNLVKKSRDEGLKQYYKRYCTILRVIKEAKKLYYQKHISNSEDKIQLTWKIINKETGKKQAPDKITELQVGKSKVTNTKEVVEVFNKYFITVAENLETKMPIKMMLLNF
jgi:late competence protein required for DNA uptake (superfamily II DNA/RNA helicase)